MTMYQATKGGRQCQIKMEKDQRAKAPVKEKADAVANKVRDEEKADAVTRGKVAGPAADKRAVGARAAAREPVRGHPDRRVSYG